MSTKEERTIKYMGSKSRIAKYIVPIIQRYIDESGTNTYIEPFVGGANVIDKIRCPTKIGSDNNPYLIALLQHVQNGEPLYNEVPRELYNKARDDYKRGISELEGWQIGNIGFLASFNGRFFDGGYARSGYEKVKEGRGYRLRYRDYYRESKDNLLKQAPNLKGIQFSMRDYRYGFGNLRNAVIYCDPPYENVKQYHNSKDFDYDYFWNWCREHSQHNAVIISEQNAPNDFDCIWERQVNRSLKPDDKRKATEKLFIYKGE